MNKVDAEYIKNVVDYILDIYEKNSNKYVLKNIKYFYKSYSRNRGEIINQCITSFLRTNNCAIPRIYTKKDFKDKNHTEYFWDEENNLLAKKEIFNDFVYDYYYICIDNHKIRLLFKYNSLIGIHCCKYCNERLLQIDNAYFDDSGDLLYISGELYEYELNRIVRCINYDRYSPLFSMFRKVDADNKSVCINPTLTEYSFIYNNSGVLNQYVLSYSDKHFEANKIASSYIDKINKNINSEQFILW